jgi:6-hydroxynicotinate 3-monooxygenase
MLSRCLGASSVAPEAFQRYEATRIERTSRIQLTSRQKRLGEEEVDPRCVYGYDVWTTPIARPRARAHRMSEL